MTAASGVGTSRLTFRLLGSLTASRDGNEVAIVGPRQKALLTYLLLHANRVVPTERLIDELFGDEPPETAVNSVHAGISRLRRQLAGSEKGDVPIVTRPPGYLIEIADDELDLRRFENRLDQGRTEVESGDAEAAAATLRAALDLWQGEPLGDLTAYRFAREEAARLEGLHLAAIAERIEADLALGRHEQVIRELEALVAAQPLQERLRAQLMLALYRAGRQADALQVYQDTRRSLVAELGLEPGRPLQRLEQQILTQDPALDLPKRAMSPQPAPAGPVRGLRWRGLALIGLTAVIAVVALAVVLLTRSDDGSRGLAAIAPNSVGVIDPQSNRLVAEIPVGEAPQGLTVGGGAIWVTSPPDGTLSRIDPARRVVLRTIPLPGRPSDAAFAGSVWVLRSRGSSFVDPYAGSQAVTEVNPHFDNVARTIAVPAGFGNTYEDPIVATPGVVWVAGETGVSKIDAASGEVHPRLSLIGVTDLVAHAKSIWALKRVGTIVRLDPSGEFVAETISVSSSSITIAAAAGYGSLWVLGLPSSAPQRPLKGSTSSLFRIDPEAGELTAKVPIGGGPAGVAVGQGAIWIADAARREVLRVDPRKNRVVARISLGARPTSIAVDDNAVWVSVT